MFIVLDYDCTYWLWSDDWLLSDFVTIVCLFSLTPQEAWPMAVGVSSPLPLERRPSTAAPPAQAPPSSHPAASCSRRHDYATACRMWCRRAGAACWRTSGTTATPTCSSETSPATSWSSARTSTGAGTHQQTPHEIHWAEKKPANQNAHMKHHYCQIKQIPLCTQMTCKQSLISDPGNMLFDSVSKSDL